MPQDGDVVADGRVDKQKLLELLALGAEQEALDFKAAVDFSNPKHQVEHLKDLLALMSLPSGGYIVVGVNNAGAIAVDHPEVVEAHFDQAVLQAKLASYIDSQTDIRSAVHVLDGRRVALIYAGPPPELFPIVVRREGQYSREPRGQVTVFQPGQVIIREGTATSALAPRHWNRLLLRYREQVKTETRRDVDALVGRIVAMLEQSERGGEAVTPIDFGMDLPTFTVAAHALVEAGSHSRLDTTLGAGIAALGAASVEERADLLNKLFTVALAAMLYGTEAQFARVIEVIGVYYDSVPGIRDAVSYTSPTEKQSAAVWRDVAVRLYLLGAEAVRRRRWMQVRVLTLHPYDITDRWGYPSWIRHAVTSASRAQVLDEGEGATLAGQTAALISRALALATTAPTLVPDFPGAVAAVPEDGEQNPLLDALCQFDLLWSMIAFSEKQQSHSFFTSSSAFDQRHAYPALVQVVEDPDLRAALFPRSADKDIAEFIDVISTTAIEQSRHNPGFNWWDSLPDVVTRWAARARA